MLFRYKTVAIFLCKDVSRFENLQMVYLRKLS